MPPPLDDTPIAPVDWLARIARIGGAVGQSIAGPASRSYNLGRGIGAAIKSQTAKKPQKPAGLGTAQASHPFIGANSQKFGPTSALQYSGVDEFAPQQQANQFRPGLPAGGGGGGGTGSGPASGGTIFDPYQVWLPPGGYGSASSTISYPGGGGGGESTVTYHLPDGDVGDPTNPGKDDEDEGPDEFMAVGGEADEPMTVEIGEGGEPEFVVPASKAQGFAASVAAGKPADPKTLPPDDNGGYSPVSASMRAAQQAQQAPPPQAPPQEPPHLGAPAAQVAPQQPVTAPPRLGTPGQAQLPPAPQRKPPGTLRRIAAAAIGAAAGMSNAKGTRGAPIDAFAAQNAIMYPGYNTDMVNYQAQVQRAQDQGKLNLEGAQAGHLNAQSTLAEQQAATLAEEGKRAPRGNYVPFGNGGVFDATEGKVVVQPPSKNPADFIEIAPDKAKALGLQPDKDGRYTIPKEGIGPYLTSQVKSEKPVTAEAEKIKFQSIVSKVAAENGIAANALSDTGRLVKSIRASQTLTPQEKNDAIGYLAANATPAAQGTTATIRVEGMGENRQFPVIDTQNGNALRYINSNDLNKAEPGRYIPTGPGTQALTRTALMEDIRGSIGQTRQALAAIPEFTPGDKALIAVALRDRDPKSAVSQLIGGAAGGHMTPQQQEYLISLAQLHEQAMAMRSVLGAGQGSDDLRAAILRTIPGPSTPNKAYAAKQLDAFESTLNRLSRGVPKVPLRDNPSPQQPTQNPNPNGYIAGHVYGGLTYIGGDPNQKSSWKQ